MVKQHEQDLMMEVGGSVRGAGLRDPGTIAGAEESTHRVGRHVAHRALPPWKL